MFPQEQSSYHPNYRDYYRGSHNNKQTWGQFLNQYLFLFFNPGSSSSGMITWRVAMYPLHKLGPGAEGGGANSLNLQLAVMGLRSTSCDFGL